MSKAALIEQDDRWFRGEAKMLTFDIVDGAGAKLDVSSFGLAWVLEELHDGVTDLLSVVTPDITVGDDGDGGTDNRVSVPISATATQGLEPRVYKQSLLRTDGGQLQLLASGSAHLQRGAEWDEGS